MCWLVTLSCPMLHLGVLIVETDRTVRPADWTLTASQDNPAATPSSTSSTSSSPLGIISFRELKLFDELSVLVWGSSLPSKPFKEFLSLGIISSSEGARTRFVDEGWWLFQCLKLKASSRSNNVIGWQELRQRYETLTGWSSLCSFYVRRVVL